MGYDKAAQKFGVKRKSLYAAVSREGRKKAERALSRPPRRVAVKAQPRKKRAASVTPKGSASKRTKRVEPRRNYRRTGEQTAADDSQKNKNKASFDVAFKACLALAAAQEAHKKNPGTVKKANNATAICRELSIKHCSRASWGAPRLCRRGGSTLTPPTSSCCRPG